MPVLNSLGQSACGVGTIALSIDGATPAALAAILGGGACWLTDAKMAFQDVADVTLKTYDTGTLAVAAIPDMAAGGANILHAGGGVAFAWRAGFGAFTNVGGFGPFPAGYSAGVGEAGDAILLTNFQVGAGLAAYSSTGVLRSSNADQLGTNQPVPVRTGYFAYRALNLSWVIRNLAGTIIPYAPRAGINWLIPLVLADGTFLVIEQTEFLTLRQKDSATGYQLPAAFAQGFNPDAREISPGVVRVCWSTNAGESRTALQTVDVVIATGANTTGVVVGTSMAYTVNSPLTPINFITGAPTLPKWVGWYYSSGRYGDFRPTQNCTILALANYKDGAGNLPTDYDARARMLGAAQAAGGIFCSGDQEDLDVMRDNWNLVAGLVMGEVATQAEMTTVATAYRTNVNASGLAARQIIATLTPGKTLSGLWNVPPAGVDAYAVEIYFDAPGAGSYAAQYAVTASAVTAVLAAVGPVPIYLIAQAYDRAGSWTDMDQVAAIIDACGDAMRVN